MIKKKKLCTVLLTAGSMLLLGTTTAGVTAAYLSAYPEEAVNTITTGSVEIALTEEHWDPDKSTALHPLETTAKDPVIKNTGNNNAWVFLKVSVPRRQIALVGAHGKKQAPQVCDLFTYEYDAADWTLLSEEIREQETCRIYGYQEVLKPGEETTALFEETTAVDYLEGELAADGLFPIHITAYAIQESGLENGQTLEQIYAEYGKQEASDAAWASGTEAQTGTGNSTK